MTFLELLSDFGSLINQYDETTDTFVSGFVTTVEAKRWLNQGFEEVYKWYSLANYQRMSSTATVSTVADQSTYSFGGDAADLLALAHVGIKYASTDDYFRTAVPTKFNDFYQYGSEVANTANPQFFEAQLLNTDTSHYVNVIEFVDDCVPDASVTNGLKIRYVARPEHMSNDTDLPERLPPEIHKYIVEWARAKAFTKMGEENHGMNIYNKFMGSMQDFFVQERSVVAKGAKKLRRSRSSVNKFMLKNR